MHSLTSADDVRRRAGIGFQEVDVAMDTDGLPLVRVGLWAPT